MSHWFKGLNKICFICTICFSSMNIHSNEYSANFQGTEINEFVNTASKVLNKTIVVDPTIKGTITVRSYDMLDESQYYQFFLSVLDVYGYAVITMDNGVLKVVRSKDAKLSATAIADENHPGVGDEIVTRIVPLHYVAGRELAPLLRQLIDNAGSGHVAHYEPSNVILLTGRAAVVNRLMKIINTVDKIGDQTLERYKLQHASAREVVKLVNDLIKSNGKETSSMAPKVIADERTNSILITGDKTSRERIKTILNKLDSREDESHGSTKVIYLKYAKAENLMNILSGVSETLKTEQSNSSNSSNSGKTSETALMNDVTIKADEDTNSLIINAPPALMYELEQIIERLDIRRAQVLVEAIIAEVEDADGLNLGIQWGSRKAGFVQFSNSNLPISQITGNEWFVDDSDDISSNLSSFSGIAAGVLSSNWRVLITALSSNSKNDILATPSIVTLDNMEATFNVGQEVPVLTGSQTNTSGDNVFNTVERKTVGIKLKVTPQINEGDTVLLQIEQEVSSVADTASSSTESLGATFNTRTLSNAVLVHDGATVVIGGLLNHSNLESVSKIPILGDLPLIGVLFRSTEISKSKSNLMLFIRPTIIRDNTTYSDLSEQKYNQMRMSQNTRLENDHGLTGKNTGTLIMPEYQKNDWSYAEIKRVIADFYAPISNRQAQ